ncbi:cobalamin biosynthesis protein CobW [Taklimakanibacter albus]|uniref:Cobalamin biosynthesis protein CobW n=1 Tax=Taklimakanibacter albus TaxID=2800327 RepID=A0ACC5R209_9HYPH|nr:cobalamin biosynthesis protein CobW [Aestuariivirga sp. YIM B02566]MBK1866668.1 cobalamin biosynthesis protein CobW [Aestuariivirga sp. YIM B02566]
MSLQKIPATVITGFLGAGKTTLIRHLLQNAKGRRIALVINEFGDIGVDGEILKGCGDEVCREEDVVELANGCICCTVADDFVPTMKKLLERDHPPEHIVIETSGLALPQPLVRAFNWPEIKSRVTVDGVVTVVDAKALSEGRFADDEEAVAAQRAADPNLDHENPIEELFEDQLNCADMIVLNKTDLLQTHETEKLSGDLKGQIRKGAKLVPAQHGALDVAALLGIASAAEDDMHNRLSHHEMEGEVQHDHDDFVTFSMSLGPIADREKLLKRIEDLIAEHDILRLKGFAAVEGAAGRLLIQAVGPRLNSYFDRPWRADEKRSSEVVVIGLKGLDRAAIEARLKG